MAISSNLKEMTDKKTGVEIISVHVPKTAGSAFGKVLLRVYGAEGVFLDYPYERDYQRRFMREGDVNVKVIHGHFSPAKYKDKFADAKRITWLREPVSFLISYYCYNKMFRRSRFYDLIEEKNLDFWEFAQMPENQNVMSVYLGKIKLEDFFFVGIQNFFEEDLQELRSMMSWQEITISRENNNRDSDYQRIKKEVLRDESLVKKVERINGEDIEMYQEALNLRKKRCGGNRGGIQKARVKQQEKKQVRGGIKSNKFQQKLAPVKGAIANNNLKKESLLNRKLWFENGRMKPSFLIIGSQKGGTTSLYKYLCDHPQMLTASHKEVNFFSRQFYRGINWYSKQFPVAKGEDLITGEASTNYIFYPHAPKRVFKFFPKIKLILLLRDPVERAISHYHYNLTINQTNQSSEKREYLSFKEAIETEKLRIREDIEKVKIDGNHDKCYNYFYYSYLKRGIYIEQLRRWMKFFPREQLLILKSEDFFQEPNVIFQKVLNFLDLPEFELPKYKQLNKGVLKSKSEIDDSMKLHLAEYFQPYNQKLEDFLGMKFDWNQKYEDLKLTSRDKL